MKAMRKMVLLTALVAAALIGLGSAAHADLELQIVDSLGHSTGIFSDSGTGLAYKIDGTLDGWTFSQNVATGYPVDGSSSSPMVDLNFGLTSGPTSGWLKIIATQTNFTTGALSVSTAAGGTLQYSTVTANTYWDPSNTAFAETNLITTQTFTTTTWNGSASGSAAGGSPYSITLVALITPTGADTSSSAGGDITLTGTTGTGTTVPIPPSVLLLGPGLLGLVTVRRRIKH